MTEDFAARQRWVWNKQKNARNAYKYAPNSRNAKELWALAKSAEKQFEKWKEENGWKQNIIY